MNCPSCKYDNPEGITECLICGAKMIVQPVEPPAQPTAGEVPSTPAPTPVQLPTPKEFKKPPKAKPQPQASPQDELMQQYLSGEGYEKGFNRYVGLALIIIGAVLCALQFVFSLDYLDCLIINIVGGALAGAGLLTIVTNLGK